MPRGPALQKLTILLLKEGVTPEDALRSDRELDGYRVPSLTKQRDSLFVAASTPHRPRWANFLEAHVQGELSGLFSGSSSVVLLFEAVERVFAVTFGQGRHLIDPESYEQDFGLKVVLNTVSPEQLKSVDSKTIDETTLHTRRDASRDSSLPAFGLDVSRDLLRAVTGTPRDPSLARRMTGADALGLWSRVALPDLPALAGKLLSAYKSDAYKQDFDFVDYLRPEKRAERVGHLEEKLIHALAARELDDMHIAAPEVLDQLDLGGFCFSSERKNKREIQPDPKISDYLRSREHLELDLARLKSDRLIAVMAADDQILRSWPVYRSIVYEVKLEDDLFVLTGGAWFRVSLDFRQRVIDELEAISRRTDLPDADRGTDEASYNLKAADALGALCLDRQLVLDGGPDRMEICDILTRERGLIHVKQRGASSTLSHLFAQGLSSGERLLTDGDFRRQAHDLVTDADASYAEVMPTERPSDPSVYEVTFAVITRSERGTPLTLPFFSLVSLRAAARSLRAFGFRVSLAEIREPR